MRTQAVLSGGIFLGTLIGASVSAMATDQLTQSLPGWAKLVSYIALVTAWVALPIALGAVQRQSVWFAVWLTGIPIFLGLVVTDLLTYSTVWQHCHPHGVEQCDPGPFPATFDLVLLPIPCAFAMLGRFARVSATAYRLRKRFGE